MYCVQELFLFPVSFLTCMVRYAADCMLVSKEDAKSEREQDWEQYNNGK